MMKRNYTLRSPDAGADGGGGAAGAGAAAGAAGAAGAAVAAVGAGDGAAGAGAAGSTGAAAASGAAATGAGGAAAAGTGAAAGASGAGGEAKAGEGKAAEVKGTWPENWRETVSKEDAKRLAQLQRYASPEAMAQALFAAQDRIRSGELKPVLGKNATPEDVKEWREAHGIPETPDKYDLGKDVKIDDSDAPLMAKMMEAAHGSNQTPEQVKATVKAWNTIKQAAFDAQATRDQEAQTKAEDTLRAEWGTEYRRNHNLIQGLLDGAMSQEAKNKFLGGRLADGTPIGSDPETLKALVGLALIQNPTGVVVPGGDANRAEGIDSEIDKIEAHMKSNRTAYNNDEKMQARYRDLLDARELHKGKR